MSITSNAVTSEKGSPYYKKNKALCEKWEQYIVSKGGKLKGYYNSWSIAIISKLTVKKTWLIDIKKSSFSNGYIWFSPKYQNLQETLIFKSLFKNTGCGNFCISRSIFSRRRQTHPFYLEVRELLKHEIDDKSLYKVKFKKSELTIVIHSRNDRFDLVDRILGFDFK